MSMNRYANAGPIMAGLAAMSEPPEAEVEPFATLADMRHSMAFVRECFRQIGEIAQQMVDIRKRLDAIEVQQRTLFKNAEAVTNLVVKDVRPRLDGLERKPQLQAQQTATAQQAVTLPLKYDIDAGCWRSGSASFATDQALVDLRIQID